jgi:hypothetical protein
MKNKLFLAIAAAAAVIAAPATFASSNDIYAGLGTTGLGVGYAYGINDHFSVRGEYAGLTYNGTYNSGGTHYDGDLKLQSAGIYGDYFPTGGAFRITVGYVSSGSKFSGKASGNNGTVTINHVDYSLAGESAKATVKFPSSMPYLGIGWGHNATKPGWGLYGDIGLQIGNPKSTIKLSPGLAAQVNPSDVRAQERQLNSDVKVLGGWPVLAFGVSYRF